MRQDPSRNLTGPGFCLQYTRAGGMLRQVVAGSYEIQIGSCDSLARPASVVPSYAWR